MGHHPPLQQRFDAKVDRNHGPCWVWCGLTTTFRKISYGRIGVGNSMLLAHRVAWELYRGPIPKGMLVCHTCDNGLCVNPEHLFLGTQRDNMRDAAAKGRVRTPQMVTGISPRRRLTDDDLRTIGSSRATSKELATQYGVTDSYIRRIRQATGTPNTKFTEDFIRQIRAAEGLGKDIAKRFATSPSHVSRVKRGQTWAHLWVRAVDEQEATDATE